MLFFTLFFHPLWILMKLLEMTIYNKALAVAGTNFPLFSAFKLNNPDDQLFTSSG